MLFWMLMACDGNKIELDDTATAADDTGTDDTGTDDTGTDDTGTTGDSDTGTVAGTAVSFALSGDWSGLTVALTGFTFGANEEIVVLDGLASAPADGAVVEVELPVPGDLMPCDAQVSCAIFAASLHDDQDGDGFPSDEPIYGVTDIWLIYLEGGVPAELAGLGLAEGWNAASLLTGGSALPLTEIPLGTNMAVVESATLGGAYDGPVSEDQRLALLPEADNVQVLLYDEALDAEWRISVAGSPPVDHLVSDGVTTYSVETPIVYLDNDRSGGASNGDIGTHVSCDSLGSTVVLAWLEPVVRLDVAMQYSVLGYHPGWSLIGVDQDGNSRLLDDQEAEDLSMCEAAF